mmetsp:Transcript_28252/g.87566  ORF Transcript_28252/g.87566 Transcript_28252/m.87566 type:complete len:224 (-) Transcript_28252:162-833(-)
MHTLGFSGSQRSTTRVAVSATKDDVRCGWGSALVSSPLLLPRPISTTPPSAAIHASGLISRTSRMRRSQACGSSPGASGVPMNTLRLPEPAVPRRAMTESTPLTRWCTCGAMTDSTTASDGASGPNAAAHSTSRRGRCVLDSCTECAPVTSTVNWSTDAADDAGDPTSRRTASSSSSAALPPSSRVTQTKTSQGAAPSSLPLTSCDIRPSDSSSRWESLIVVW